jgi:hypothetical protein
MPDEQALETLQLKSRIEQAVFFGAFNRVSSIAVILGLYQ